MRHFAAFLALVSAGLVLVGFGASAHRAADSLALLRPLAGGVSLAFAVLYGRSWLGGLSLVAAALATVTVLPPFLSRQTPGEVTVYTKNLWFGNTRTEALLADMRASDADVILLQEVGTQNIALLAALTDQWPHQHLCPFSSRFGVAIASRYPLSETTCSKNRALALARVAFPQGSAWVASVHLPWPWPMDTAETEAEVPRILSPLNGPVVIGGDFNSFPWTKRVKGLARATGTQLAGPSPVTLYFKGLPLPIDHVIAPGGGTLERRPVLGGDHHGLLARVHLSAQ